MRAAGGDNHHDLGLFSVGPRRAAAAARLGRALPPRLGGPDHRGPRRRRPGSCPRTAPSVAPPTTACPSRSTAPTRTATSSRSCGASRASRGASTRSTASVLPLDLDAEVRPGARRPDRPAGPRRVVRQDREGAAACDPGRVRNAIVRFGRRFADRRRGVALNVTRRRVRLAVGTDRRRRGRPGSRAATVTSVRM